MRQVGDPHHGCPIPWTRPKNRPRQGHCGTHRRRALAPYRVAEVSRSPCVSSQDEYPSMRHVLDRWGR